MRLFKHEDHKEANARWTIEVLKKQQALAEPFLKFMFKLRELFSPERKDERKIKLKNYVKSGLRDIYAAGHCDPAVALKQRMLTYATGDVEEVIKEQAEVVFGFVEENEEVIFKSKETEDIFMDAVIKLYQLCTDNHKAVTETKDDVERLVPVWDKALREAMKRARDKK